VVPATIDALKGIELIMRQIAKGKALQEAAHVTEEAFNVWETVSEEIVVRAFGRNSDKHQRFSRAGRTMMVPIGHQPPAYFEQRRREKLIAKLSELGAFVSVLELEADIPTSPGQSENARLFKSANNSDVFVVHGRDNAAKDGVARFLEKLQLNAIILHEQPNKGRTIIEKFVDSSDVGFAIVLLTPDDRGGLASERYDSQKPRARQNVLLELGFFLGKLGRSRVCALYSQGVEIPSDYDGVAFVPLGDSPAWQFAIAKELRSAGFKIDMNLL
jgi:predicted nucleotide-binding protein